MKKSDKLARSELSMQNEINKCVLCYDAPCKKIYKNIDPSRIIRAIKFDEDRKPHIDGKKCMGCQLCRLVCPQKAIEVASKRVTKIESKMNRLESDVY